MDGGTERTEYRMAFMVYVVCEYETAIGREGHTFSCR